MPSVRQAHAIDREIRERLEVAHASVVGDVADVHAAAVTT
jgi:hypothetical protein